MESRILSLRNNSCVKLFKELENRASQSVKKEVNKFTGWIRSHVPKTVKKAVNDRAKDLKGKINKIYRNFRKPAATARSAATAEPAPAAAAEPEPRLRESALRGFLHTYRINGQNGTDYQSFFENNQNKVKDLISKQEKPIKMKLILTCEFYKIKNLY